MLRTPVILFTLCFMFSIGFVQAQVTSTESGRLKLSDEKRSIEFDFQGKKEFSIPCQLVNGVQKKIGDGFISNAILEQLRQDSRLRNATYKVANAVMPEGTAKNSSGRLMYEIITGAGYYLECEGKVCGDVKFGCRSTPVEYRLLVDTLENNLYVAEIEAGKVIEIVDVLLGVDIFEFKPQAEERYENAVYPERGNQPCDCAEPEPTFPPLAVIKPSTFNGKIGVQIQFNGEFSTDRDEQGFKIVDYKWDFGERGSGKVESIVSHTFFEAGEFPVSLEVTDNEGEKHDTTITITVQEDVVTPPPPPTPEPPKASDCDTVYVNNGCCDSLNARINNLLVLVEKMAEPKQEADSAERDFQLAGGPVFIQNDGQLLEYAMGLDIQIRYPFKKRPSWQFMMDGTYFPRRVANPLDDRPHLWSELRDNIDPITNTLPLHWRRGTRRATASFAIGVDYKPKKRILLKGLYFQGMIGLERTFNQIEASDPLKDPSNEFIGFDLDVFFIESRVGLRKKHLEVYLGGRFLEESRPFSLVLANPLGGSHHRSFDNTIHAGISVWY
ncbi:MAG: PKD domain-containing protein [Bacteroidota bacterium]